MIRTQIELESDEAQWLENQATARGASKTEVVRDLIRRAAGKAQSGPKPKSLNARQRAKLKRRFPFVGCINGGGSTDVTRLDDYLYGNGDQP